MDKIIGYVGYDVEVQCPNCGRIRRVPDSSICRVANELATGVDRI